MKSRILYIECKEESLSGGTAHIGRVTFSKSGKSLRYGNKTFRSLKGQGFKANYFPSKAATSIGFRVASATAATGFMASAFQFTSTPMRAKNIGRRFAICPTEKTSFSREKLVFCCSSMSLSTR